MRASIPTLAVVCVMTLTCWQLYQTKPNWVSHFTERSSEDPTARTTEETDHSNGFELILDLERYEDADYGFSMAIPSGWTRIVAADIESEEMDEVLAPLEPGYAVGFESPRSGSADRFADYILLEILPGDEIGLFESMPEDRRYLASGGVDLAYERLSINHASNDSVEVDLIIFQRGVQAFGYTLAFYAIGEPANEQALFDAFRIMLFTFEQLVDPFVII